MSSTVNNSTNSSTSKNNNYLDKSVAQQKAINVLQGVAKKKADSNNIEDNIRKQELKAELKHTQQKVQEIKDPLLKQNVARVQEGEVKSQYTYIPQVLEKSANLSTEAEHQLASKMESLVLNNSLTSKTTNLSLNNYSMMSEEKIGTENPNFSSSSLKNEAVTNPVVAKFIKMQVSLSNMSAKLMNAANKTDTSTKLSYQTVAQHFLDGQDDLINKAYDSRINSANQSKNAAFANIGGVASQIGQTMVHMGARTGIDRLNEGDLGVQPFEKIANATNEKMGGLILPAADEKVDDNLLSLLAPNTALAPGKLAPNFQADALDKLVNTVEPVLDRMKDNPTVSLADEAGRLNKYDFYKKVPLLKNLVKAPNVAPPKQMQDTVAEELLNFPDVKDSNKKIEEFDKVATDFSGRSEKYARLSKEPVILATESSIDTNAANANVSTRAVSDPLTITAKNELIEARKAHLAAPTAATRTRLRAAKANPDLSLPPRMEPATSQQIVETLREGGIFTGSTMGLKVSTKNEGVISLIIEDPATGAPRDAASVLLPANRALGTFHLLSVSVRRVDGKWASTGEISLKAEIKLSGDELTRMRQQSAIDFGTKSSLVSVLYKSPSGANNDLQEEIKTSFQDSIAGKDEFKEAVEFAKDYAFARKLNEKTGVGQKYVEGASKSPAQKYADIINSRTSRDDMQQNVRARNWGTTGNFLQVGGTTANVTAQNYQAMASQSTAIADQQSAWQGKQGTTLTSKNAEAQASAAALSQAEQGMLSQLTQTNADVGNALGSSTTK